MIRALLLAFVLLAAAPASAQTYPALSGPVVDEAGLLDEAQEQALTAKLEALRQATGRQLVVAIVPDLQDRPLEDFANGLFRHWRLGQAQAHNGALLLVSVAEKKVRIEVGYGLEGIVTDALSSRIIREQMTPRFREGDFAGGINGAVDALIAQLQAPPEAAEQRVQAAAQAESRSSRGRDRSPFPIIFWVIVAMFIIFSMIRSGSRGGRRYRRGRGWAAPVIIWGAGGGWGGGSSRGSWGGGGGGGSWGGGGGGGYSGGGGSSGGGGASGGW